MDSSTASEDTGKKRVGATVEEDKSKKVRVQTDRLLSTANANVADLTDSHTDRTTGRTKKGSPGDNHIVTTVWDLESALLYLTRITESSNNEKEFLSKEDRSAWVDFRVGHAGDASTIANWYQQSSLMESSEPELEVKINTVQEADVEADDSADAEPSTTSSMLEVWLADGLGDEDHPPAVHALLAQVHKKSEEEDGMIIGSVALLNLAWERGERVLRVPWILFDSTLSADLLKALEQRTWLRISLLAQMTACQSITVEKRLTAVASDTDDKKDRPSPSAE